MNEIIELKSYRSNESDENVSEEYHEISNELLLETEELYPLKTKTIKEYDFFTAINTKSSKNQELKKKKAKKKQKPTSLMELIRSELAAKPLLVENQILRIDHTKEQTNYIENIPRITEIFQRRISQNRYTRDGLQRHRQRTGIIPIFPLVLENRINKDLSTPSVHYKEPILFENVVSEFAENDVKKNRKFLDVVLNNIRFKHHHEFCLEELLCAKVTELYGTYETIKENLKAISKTIEINRRTRHNLKEQLLKISPNRHDDIKFDINVQKYTEIMITAKQKYQFVIQDKKQTIHQIVSLWEDIKMVREKCNRVRRNLIVEVISNELDRKEYELQWRQLFEMEYTDSVIKIEYDYIKRYKEYKELKRQNNALIQKPKLEVNYENLKIQVEEIVNDIMSDNKFDLNLKCDDNIITNDNEKRKSIFANNISFKVYVDDVFVCGSEEYQTKRHRFDIDFFDALSIEILPHNSKISLILFENSEPVSFYNVNLAKIKNNNDIKAQEFVYNIVSEPSSKCIGSGYDIKSIAVKNKVRLKSSNIFKGKLFTRCEVFIKLGWNDKLNNDNKDLIKSSIDIRQMILRLLNGTEEPTLDSLKAAISNLYESNIEDNENIKTALKSICKRVISKDEIFSCDEINTEYNRFKLLHLRNDRGLVDMENNSVPLFASQFSTEQLGYLQNTTDEDDVDYYKFQSDSKMNSIDLQRFIGVKFVEKINANLASIVNRLLMKKTYKDVVRDFEDMSLRGLISNSINLSLGDPSKFRKQEILEENLLKEQEIQVIVLRAFNLLDRSKDNDRIDDDDIVGFKIHPLRPLVKVSYHGASVQTSTAIGCHPTWNTTVKIKSKLEPLSSIHIDVYDQCKEGLQSFSDVASQGIVNYRKYNKWLGGLKIPLYTVLELGEVRGTFKINTPPLILGYENMSLNIQPTAVSELMNHMKKETSLISLQITTTLSYLGGLQTYFQPLLNDSDDDFVIRRLNEFVSEYRNDFPSRNISLTFIDSSKRNKCVTEFVQPIPVPENDYFPSDPRKSESALSKSSGYSKSSSSKSSRKKSIFVVENEKDLEQYKTDENMLTKIMEAALRYVSLIPTYEVKESHVTFTGVELLKVLYGSPLDHTILLASYFLQLGIECWIVIGSGLPRGQSSYVLVKYYGNKPLMVNEPVRNGGFLGKSMVFSWYIYDAVSGERYSLREIGCPLRNISYVFNCENIWVNIQNSQDCESVAIDFTKSSDWQVVFSKPLFSLRPASEGLYTKPSDVEDLRLSLETKIKNKIQKWRSHVKTIWNRYCSSLLRDSLAQWEHWAFNRSQPRPVLGHRMKQLMASYKIFGFPINTSYLNTQLVISAVKSTALHVNDDPNVEFGLAVEVYAYPNNVLSVWVFLASVTRI